MAPPADTPPITSRTLLRASEVCQIAELRAYVLRSWEAEFPSLGVARAPGGSRMYRKRDLERVLLIKRLVFVEGLTLAGVRRRLDEPVAGSEDEEIPDLGEVLGAEARELVADVQRGLRSLLDLLSVTATPEAEAKPVAATRKTRDGRTTKVAAKAGTGKKAIATKAASSHRSRTTSSDGAPKTRRARAGTTGKSAE